MHSLLMTNLMFHFLYHSLLFSFIYFTEFVGLKPTCFFLPARCLIHLYPCPCKSICLSVCSLSVRLSVCPFVCLSVYLEHLFLYVTQFFNTSHLWLNLPMNIIFYLISHHYFLIYFYMCI